MRVKPQLPGEDSPDPKTDYYAVVPATSNTVGKLTLGLADNQALTEVCEAIGGGTIPVVVFHASTPPTPVSRPGPATSPRSSASACIS